MISAALSGWTVFRCVPALGATSDSGPAITSVAIEPYHSEHSPGHLIMVLVLGRVHVGLLLCKGVPVERRYFTDATSVDAWFERRLSSRLWKRAATVRLRGRKPTQGAVSGGAPPRPGDWRTDGGGLLSHFHIVSTACDYLALQRGECAAGDVERALRRL